MLKALLLPEPEPNGILTPFERHGTMAGVQQADSEDPFPTPIFIIVGRR